MGSQYENVHVADYDVVRSTQFIDDMTHGVCVLHMLWSSSSTTLMHGLLAIRGAGYDLCNVDDLEPSYQF